MRGFLAFIFLMMVPAACLAQTTRTATGGGVPRVRGVPVPAYNSMSKGTTPFHCEQWRGHPHPGMVGFCESVEASTLQGEARRAGRPGPSTEVIDLPPLGSSEAKQLGYSCVGGQAMRKLKNGYAQVMSKSGGWLRCRGG